MSDERWSDQSVRSWLSSLRDLRQLHADGGTTYAEVGPVVVCLFDKLEDALADLQDVRGELNELKFLAHSAVDYRCPLCNAVNAFTAPVCRYCLREQSHPEPVVRSWT